MAMVGRPDQVAVSQVEGSLTSSYELKIAPQDVGKVICWQDRNVSALRTILNAAADEDKEKMILKTIG